MKKILTTPHGTARVLTADEVAGEEWAQRAFAGQCKDLRYHTSIAATLEGGFDLHWLLLEDEAGKPRALQPFFLVDQDLVLASGPGTRTAVARVRRFFPRCLRLRMLMVGTPSGGGHLGVLEPGDEPWAAEALHSALAQLGPAFGAALVLLKDFPPADRPRLAPFSTNGYTRIPSMPMTRLALDFASFEEFMRRRLSKVMRKNLRRKFRHAAQQGPLTLEVLTDATPVVDEIYPLYLQVHERSAMQFERLTRETLCRIGRELPEQTRFFVWRREGRAVAFSLCLVHDGAIHDEYLGLDYAVALDLHLYFVTLRDVLEWAVAHGLRHYYSTPLNYDPKLHLRFELAPLDLYAAHTSRWVNPIFRRILPLVQPARSDPHIHRFANAHEL